LADQLRRAVTAFYNNRASKIQPEKKPVVKKAEPKTPEITYVHQCVHCLTVYDPAVGEPDKNIAVGTSFHSLPDDYSCSLCEGPKADFKQTDKEKLGLQSV
jgi:rubredoxin